MADIFCELLSIKEPQKTLPNKETTKALRKCWIKTPRKALGIDVALSNCTREIGMDNFGCLNSSYFIFIL